MHLYRIVEHRWRVLCTCESEARDKEDGQVMKTEELDGACTPDGRREAVGELISVRM